MRATNMHERKRKKREGETGEAPLAWDALSAPTDRPTDRRTQPLGGAGEREEDEQEGD